MPGLTVDTNSANSSPASRNDLSQDASQASPTPQGSRPSSPTQPPYSPLTPVLAAAPVNLKPPSPPPRPLQTFAHVQPDATFIPPPAAPLEVLDFDTNPDVLAVKSAISILQLQRQNATQHIQDLHRLKNQALQDPAAFIGALERGEIRKAGDAVYPALGVTADDKEDEDEEYGDDNAEGRENAQCETNILNGSPTAKRPSFPPLPQPQKVVSTPAINWAKYGIVGDSLDKLHEDQLQNPTPGSPAKLGPDGQVLDGYPNAEETPNRETTPLSPDKSEKSVGTAAKKLAAKGGKAGKKKGK